MATKKAQTVERDWEEIQPFTEPITLEPGESIVGHYLGSNEIMLAAKPDDDGAEEIDGQWKRRALLHEFQVEDTDEPTGLWGSAVLDKRLADVTNGAFVKVQYDGKRELEGGRTARQYRVWVDKSASF